MGTRRSVATDVVAVAAVSMSQIGLAVSLAVLIFAGPAEPALPRAISSFVFGAAIVCGLIGWRSRISIVISGAQDTAAVVLVAVAASVAAGSTNDPALDVIVLMIVSTGATGLVMITLGRLGLSNVVRYLPTTVVAAFVAGTGWLLFKGGMDVMASDDLGRGDLGHLLRPESLKLWVPGVALGLITVVLGRSRRVPTSAASIAVILAVLGFFAVTATVSSLSKAEAGGWLIGPFPQSQGLQLVTPADLGNTSWGAIASASPGIVAVVLVSVVGILLNLSGFELLNRSRIDLDAELTTAGLGNLLIAPFGGLIGYHLLGDTGLAKNLGARSRLVALGSAGVGVLVAVGGTELIGYLPRFVAGGLLAGVGFGLLAGWGRELRRSSSATERVLSVLIVGVIATVGILEGIAFGVVAACAIFVFRYSRVDPVRLEISGAEMKSRVDRGREANNRLTAASEQVAIYTLQGYLFFGTTSGLVERVLNRSETAGSPLSSLIFDFRHVTGIDHSAFAVLRRLGEDVTDSGAKMIWSGLDSEIRRRFELNEPGVFISGFVFPDLDMALEASEERLLTSRDDETDARSTQHVEIGLSPSLLAAFEQRTLPAGTKIVSQGDHSDTVYIVVRGTLTAWHSSEHGTVSRLRRFSGGAVIGEIGFLVGGGRTADVSADTEVEVLALTRDAYERLRESRSDLALELQDYFLTHIARRLATTNISLASAMR